MSVRGQMAAVLVGVLAVAGCGGGDDATTTAATGEGQDPGAAVFLANGCGSCHTYARAGSSGHVGPELDHFGPGDADAVRAAIVSPPAGTIMPEDFGTRIEPADLDALVEFIASD